ncbi:unnamed protein product [Toxocara canis]|uniref:Uncharacterized protein n=1 Tax=Toxocara canis TaxID=6265 RepID=A0A183V6V2_TOXCA|nr:unnamed protein product [Toxocara canis]
MMADRIESCGRQKKEELHAQAVRCELNTVVAHLDDKAAAYERNVRAALSAAPQSIAYMINIIYVWCTTAILHIIDALF